jgi:hypothetical protein
LATAVTIYNGLAYVADSLSGLEVINYVPYDGLGIPPTISLAASFPLNPAQAEEGKIVRVTANVADDVQVRNVEFYIDGVKVATDGNFPFEYRFTTPLLGGNRTNFTIRARATDTGGNFAWSEQIVVRLVPDATPPLVRQVFPAQSAIIGQADLLVAYFNEPIAEASLSAASFRLRSAGPDGKLDTADDTSVTTGIISYRSDINGLFLNFPTNLPAALYRASVNPPLADLAGNPLTAPFSWQFWITGGIDSDQDGVPDDVEIAMGLDPHNPDTNGNGVLDGDEDFDGDGLSNKWEILFGYNPRVKDTDSNGINDDQEDLDNDGLSNIQEQLRHTDPRNPDTDGDGWPDEAEVTAGSDPLDPGSRPKLFVMSQPGTTVMLPTSVGTRGVAPNVIVASPQVSLVLPSGTGGGGFGANVVFAQPSVSIVLPGGFGSSGFPPNVVFANPSVSIVLPSSSTPNGLGPNVIVAQPAVSLVLPGSAGVLGNANNVTVAQPPIKVSFANP